MTLIRQIGQLIPVFQMQDSKGQIMTPDHFLGHPTILYFYPKDDTPDCTQQACDLRDHKILFDQVNAIVIGISPDTAASHQQFMSNHALNFILVPDPYHELCSLFGVWEEKKGKGSPQWQVTRTTFVIDAKGIIRWIEKPVVVEGHAERVLQALHNLPKVSDAA